MLDLSGIRKPHIFNLKKNLIRNRTWSVQLQQQQYLVDGSHTLLHNT
jgi:type II restriction/modification system DNA methylase subunit YeeA